MEPHGLRPAGCPELRLGALVYPYRLGLASERNGLISCPKGRLKAEA